MVGVGKFTPTVEQISKDTLTQIAYKFWSKQDDSAELEKFDPNLVEDIYLNELVNTR